MKRLFANASIVGILIFSSGIFAPQNVNAGGSISIAWIPTLIALFGDFFGGSRHHDIKYINPPVISEFPPETTSASKTAVACLLRRIGRLSETSETGAMFKRIEGKTYRILSMPSNREGTANGATKIGEDIIYINQDGIEEDALLGNKNFEYLETVFHELVHQAAELAHEPGVTQSYLDKKFWRTAFGRRLSEAWREVFGRAHPWLQLAYGTSEYDALFDPFDSCFGYLGEDDRPPAAGFEYL